MTFTYTYQLFTPSGALAARIHRHIEDLVTPRPTVVVTGSWLTVEEQMPDRYATALAERGFTAVAEALSTVSFATPGGIGHLGVCASAQYTLRALRRGAPIAAFASADHVRAQRRPPSRDSRCRLTRPTTWPPRPSSASAGRSTVAVDYTELFGGEPATMREDLVEQWRTQLGRLDATQHVVTGVQTSPTKDGAFQATANVVGTHVRAAVTHSPDLDRRRLAGGAA